MKTARVYLFLLATLIACSPNFLSAAPLDFDADGNSEIVTYSGTTKYTIKGLEFGVRTELFSEEFGTIATDGSSIPVCTNFLSDTTPSIGTLFTGTNDNGDPAYTWRIRADDGTIAGDIKTGAPLAFGTTGDVAFSGADLDGNGITDPVVVRKVIVKEKSLLKFYYRLNPFTTNSSNKSYQLGKNGDRGFIMSRNGTNDALAVFGPNSTKTRGQLTIYDIKNKKKYTAAKFPVRFTKGERPRPFRIQSGAGADYLGFSVLNNGDQELTVCKISGSCFSRRLFDGAGTFIVGDFDSERTGDEILFIPTVTTGTARLLDTKGVNISEITRPTDPVISAMQVK